MNVRESIRVAIVALAANRLRSVLTMLGIIIGVAAVIVLVSLGRGLEKYISDQFESFGSNMVYIVSVPPGEASTMEQMDKAESVRGALGISNADVEAIGQLPNVAAAAPGIERWARVVNGNYDTLTTLFATSPEMADMRNWHPIVGRFITEEDVLTDARVVVMGTKAVEDLFPPDVYPIDQRVRIEGKSFRVVGIMEEKGNMMGQSMDDIVFVPITSAQRFLYNERRRDGQPEVNVVQVQAFGPDEMDVCIQEVTELLRERHGIHYRDADDFEVASQDEMLSALGQIMDALTLFLALIAGISLVVGGIGIMNIMLVSVTERTREIGLRKAVGAKRRDILTQFLIEAVVMAVMGGLIGILLGAVGATGLAAAAEGLAAYVSWDAVLLATSISAMVGVFFGLYPAWRAARLNPIDALRYE